MACGILNNFEISLSVLLPNTTTSRAITYTNMPRTIYRTWKVVVKKAVILPCSSMSHGKTTIINTSSIKNTAFRAVLTWLLNYQYQSNYYSDQSQQEQIGWWTNQTSLQYAVTFSQHGKITCTRCDWFWFCFSFGEKLALDVLSQSLSIAITIMYS